MKKPSLNNFGITAAQHSKYQDYKSKIEDRKIGREGFEHRFYKTVNITIAIILILVVTIVAKIVFTKIVSNTFTDEKLVNLVLLILTILVIATLFYFIIRMVVRKSIIKKLQLLKTHRPFKRLYIKLQPSIVRESYFDNAREYEIQNEKYYNYIGNLQKKFPDIIEFDNNLQVYAKKTIDEVVNNEHRSINSSIANQELEKQRAVWLKMDGITFERQVSVVYSDLGYEAKKTKATGEGGVDIRLWKDEEYSIVQCKNTLHETGKSTVRSLLETIQKEKASKGILICSGGFNSSAYEFAKRKPIELLNLNQFLKLVNQAYPQESKLINTVLETSISNADTTYTLKVIGKTSILYSSHSHSHEMNYCLFETHEDAKKVINTLKRIDKRTIGNPTVYNIEEWWLESTPSDYFRKPVYYIKVKEKEKEVKVAPIKKESWYKKHIQREIWPTEVYIQKEIWGTEGWDS